jgi:hypothetical protein
MLWFNRPRYHRIGANHSSIPNTVWSLYFTPGIQHNIVANFTPGLAAEAHIRVQSTQSDTLKNHHIAADPPRSNHTADRVCEKNARPDLALGCDFQPKENNVQVG